jgi:hypothetical protein
MPETTKRIDARNSVVELGLGSAIQFAAGTEKNKLRQFEMTLYTGKRVSLGFFWGEVVIDLAGVKTRDKMPMLQNHQRDRIAGYSSKVSAGLKTGLAVEGYLSASTEAGREISSTADEGFPWQASVGLSVKSIEEVKQGESAEVNGRSEPGPVIILRKTIATEGSFTPLGADDDTKVAVFAGEVAGEVDVEVLNSRKENNMPEDKNPAQIAPPVQAALSVETLKRDHQPLAQSLLDEGKAQGAKAERERISKIRSSALTGQDELVDRLVKDGASFAEAAEQLLADARERTGKALAQLKTQAAPPVGQPEPATPSATAAAPKPEDSKLVAVELSDEESVRFAAVMKKWRTDAELRSEFGVVEGVSDKHAEARLRMYLAAEGFVVAKPA